MSPIDHRAEAPYGHNLEVGAAIEVILPVLATAGVVLKHSFRYKKNVALKLDDYLILGSLPLSWGLWAIWIYIATALVPSSISTIPPTNLSRFMLWLWIHNLFNVVCVFLIKISVLIFYLRAFVTTRTAKSWWSSLLVVNVIQFLMRIANIFVSCFPLHNTWDNPFSCTANEVFLHKLTIFTESFGLVTEFGLLVFPLPFVWQVNLGVLKKLAICVVFFFGTLTCATQAVRIYVLEMYLFRTSDIGRDVTAPSLVLCALFETSLGTFIICVVSIWAPLRKSIYRLFLRISHKTRSTESMRSSSGDQLDSIRSPVTGATNLKYKGSVTTSVTEVDTVTSPSTIAEAKEEIEPWGFNIGNAGGWR